MASCSHGFVGRVLMTLTLALAVVNAGAAGAGAEEVRTFMNNYHTAFDTGHAGEIVAMYDAPLYMLAPNGDLRVFDTAKDIRLTIKKWKKYMIHSGFDHTKVGALHVKALTDSTALASTTFDRHTTKGRVYQRGAATYTLRKRDDKWKIFLIHIHDPAAVIAFD